MSLNERLFKHQVLVVNDHAEHIFLGNADEKTYDAYEGCLKSLLAMMPELRQARQEKEELKTRANVVYDELIVYATANFPKDKPVQREEIGAIPGGFGGIYHPDHGNILAGLPTSWFLMGGYTMHSGGGRKDSVREPAIYSCEASLTPSPFHEIVALEAVRLRAFIESGEQFLAQHACVVA